MVGLVLVGILVMLVGAVAMLASVALHWNGAEGEVKGGGVIMIGPIPLVFGSDAMWASVAMIIAVILIVVSLLARVA